MAAKGRGIRHLINILFPYCIHPLLTRDARIPRLHNIYIYSYIYTLCIIRLITSVALHTLLTTKLSRILAHPFPNSFESLFCYSQSHFASIIFSLEQAVYPKPFVVFTVYFPRSPYYYR